MALTKIGKEGIANISNSSDATAITIDSSENVMFGTTTFNPYSSNVNGVSIRGGNTSMQVSKDGQVGILINRKTSDGQIIQFGRDGVSKGSIGTQSADRTYIANANIGLTFNQSNYIMPSNGSGAENDNSVDLGKNNSRFDDIYATNGTIQTSDRNEKQDIEELSDAEKRVAVVAKGLMRKYRWKDKVAEKGDNARTHFGIIAQDLQDAFTAESLDASKYAMFCSNTWWEKEISVDAIEADEEKGIEAKDAYTYMDTKQEATEGYTEKTRLGVRYSELLAFIISAI